MATVTDPEQDEAPGSLEARRVLLDHPQPLGILPTMWFWQDRSNWRLIMWPFIVIMWVVYIVVIALDLPIWATGLAAAGTLLLIQGLIERYIRHAAKRRFRPRPEPPALGQEREDNP